MFSEAEGNETGFAVKGKYDVGANEPPCGWRTEYDIPNRDHLAITADNIMPDDREAKGAETVPARVKNGTRH